jgi:hypothetical protein
MSTEQANAPLPRRTTTVVSNSTSTRTTTDSDVKPPSAPTSAFTSNDRTWFNVKDLTTIPLRGRAYQRVLWVVTVCWIVAFVLALAGFLLAMLSSKLALIFFVVSALVAFVLPIVFPWPVSTEANQYWVQLGIGGFPIRFLKQDMGGYKIHFIRPHHSVRFYRANKPLKCDVKWASSAFPESIELKVTAMIEFEFDATRALKKEYLTLLNLSDEELQKWLTAGLLNALNQAMQDTVRIVGLSHIWDQGIPALIQRMGAFFKKVEERGCFISATSSAIYMTLPRQIAQQNLKAWAEEAKAQASRLEMKVFFDFAGQQPNAEPVFKMINSDAHLRVTVPGPQFIQHMMNQSLLGSPQGGIWVDPLTLSYGNIIQGFSRRAWPDEEIVPAQLPRAQSQPQPQPTRDDNEFPRRPPRYG